MDASAAHGKTIFVRNLPYSATNSDLEKLFSEDGPLKRSFVVPERDADTCRGFGYVTFSLRDDAEKAVKIIRRLGGRKLSLTFANKKLKKEKKKCNAVPEDNNATSELTSGESDKKRNLEVKNSDELTKQKQPVKKDELIKQKPPVKKEDELTKLKRQAVCTVVVSGFKEGTDIEAVQKLICNKKHIASVIFPAPDRDTPTALIVYKEKKEAVKLCKHLQDKSLRALLLSQEIASKNPHYQKKCKIIVRNLSFKCSVDDLKKAFTPFGDVTEAIIPKKKDGRKIGIGFVTLCNLASAAKAVEGMNLKPILDRPVAVDWTVPRDKYLAAKTDTNVTKEENSEPEQTAGKVDDQNDDEGSFSAASDKSKSDNEDSESSSDEAEEVDSSDDDESSGEESGESSDDDDDGSNSNSGSDSGMDDEDDDDDDTGSADGGREDSAAKERSKPSLARRDDTSEGRTLFLRNISFDTEEEDLEEELEEFGELEYCRLVIDPNTEHPRGTGFVKFRRKEDAEKCIEAANASDRGVVVDGRRLGVSLALSKDKAQSITKDKKNAEVSDKRNLWLAREGLIRPGTQAAEGLSKDDLAKRLKVEQLKRSKLRNPNIFVSTTRLCIRNLPITLGDQALRKKVLEAVSERAARVTECRVMRDLARLNAQKVGKSRGYAFVNFTQHAHALCALRALNNNPDVFGEGRRPIVEFSLENKAALLAKEKRLERIQLKARQKKESVAATEAEAKAARRGRNQRQKVALSNPPTRILAPVAPPDGQEATKLTVKKGAMPSHWGPKVRHKARPQASKSKKKKSPSATTQPQKRPAEQKPKASKRTKKGVEKTDSFDALVAKYRGGFGSSSERGKWSQ